MKNVIDKIYINIKKILKFVIYSIIIFFTKRKKFKLISDEEVVDRVVSRGYSLCRYGDGEFQWMIGEKFKSFQEASDEMSAELKNILYEYKPEDKILIGINKTLNTTKGLTFEAKLYWKEFLIRFGKRTYELLPTNIEYCDSSITRPYMDFHDKSEKTIGSKFRNLRRMWDKRNILIVEGEFSKLGVENDFFDNVSRIRRIICPAQNAFSKYEQIYDTIKKYIENGELILLSLGPTATVLSYKLYKNGYQCLDIGHIDIEYMWYKNKCKTKEPIAGRYVNETEKNETCQNIIEIEEYEKQIIEKILLD